MRFAAGVLTVFSLLLGGVAGCGSDEPESSESTTPITKKHQQGAERDAKAAAERAKEKAEARRERRARRREARQREKAIAAERREEETAKRKKELRTGGWSGVHADNYEIAKFVCRSKSKEGVARDLGLSSTADEFEIAEEYAAGYRESFQQPNFEGCLAGLGIG